MLCTSNDKINEIILTSHNFWSKTKQTDLFEAVLKIVIIHTLTNSVLGLALGTRLP